MTSSNKFDLSPSSRIGELRNCVARLAAPAVDQMHWLRSFGAPVSELVEAFDDQLRLSGQFLSDRGDLSVDQVARLRGLLAECDALLKPDDYEDEGLRSGAAWETIRTRATAVLEGLPQTA